MDVASSLLPADKRDSIVAIKDDSRMYAEAGAHANDPWLTRSLWAGLVPHHGPSWTVLLGTPQELASAFLAYGEIGVNEFMLSGWPEVDELVRFGEDVLPLIRDGERRQVA
jgi:alkanesulfonate monooxygenase